MCRSQASRQFSRTPQIHLLFIVSNRLRSFWRLMFCEPRECIIMYYEQECTNTRVIPSNRVCVTITIVQRKIVNFEWTQSVGCLFIVLLACSMYNCTPVLLPHSLYYYLSRIIYLEGENKQLFAFKSIWKKNQKFELFIMICRSRKITSFGTSTFHSWEFLTQLKRDWIHQRTKPS